MMNSKITDKTKVLLAVSASLMLVGCGNSQDVQRSAINGGEDSKEEISVAEEDKDKPITESEESEHNDSTEELSEVDAMDVNVVDDEEDGNWEPIDELDGMEVCGLLYSQRPYKESWTPFVNSPIDDGYYVVSKNEMFGLLELSDVGVRWVVSPDYPVIHYAYDYFISTGYDYGDLSYTLSGGDLAILDESGYWDTNGGGLDPAIVWNSNTSSLMTFSEQSLAMCSDGSDPSQWAIDQDFKYSGTLACGLYDGTWDNRELGIITNNQPVTDFIFDAATTLSNGLIAVKKDGKWGYVDADGNEIIPCEYEAIRTSEYYYEYSIKHSRDKSPDFYTEETATLFRDNWLDNFVPAACTDGYVVLSQDGEYALYTNEYAEVIPFGEYESLSEVNNGRLFAKKNGKWGIVTLP